MPIDAINDIKSQKIPQLTKELLAGDAHAEALDHLCIDVISSDVRLANIYEDSKSSSISEFLALGKKRMKIKNYGKLSERKLEEAIQAFLILHSDEIQSSKLKIRVENKNSIQALKFGGQELDRILTSKTPEKLINNTTWQNWSQILTKTKLRNEPIFHACQEIGESWPIKHGWQDKTIGDYCDFSLKELLSTKNFGKTKLRSLIKTAIYLLSDRRKTILDTSPEVRLDWLKTTIQLDLREQEIYTRRSRGDTLDEIGRSLNVTRERIRQIQQAILFKYRSPIGLKTCSDYLDQRQDAIWHKVAKGKSNIPQSTVLDIDHLELAPNDCFALFVYTGEKVKGERFSAIVAEFLNRRFQQESNHWIHLSHSRNPNIELENELDKSQPPTIDSNISMPQGDWLKPIDCNLLEKHASPREAPQLQSCSTVNMTVREAIISILKESTFPLSTKEILGQITDKGLYDFNTEHPENIVNKATRRHCIDVHTDDSRKEKYFKEGPKGKYTLLPEEIIQDVSVLPPPAHHTPTSVANAPGRLSFIDLVNTLSKSAAAAVRAKELPEALKEIKEYLYIQTDIEKAFKKALEAANENTIIFLCGSSGDGKSELLTRFQKKHDERYLFHLDGTHSYHPEQTAIQALDDRFREHSGEDKPLVIGINIGMLANYSDDGSDEFERIKTAITRYLDKRIDEDDDDIEFINFELYSKFKEDNGAITAPFIETLLNKVTQEDESNPFHRAYLQSLPRNPSERSKLEVNFELLRRPEIRETIIRTLLLARLKSNLFLTARTLLDFVHSILTEDGYLFDNLFTSSGSELLNSLSLLSPHQLREKEIDMFIINKTLSLDEPGFATFQATVQSVLCIYPETPDSWIRFFYVAQDLTIDNDYHHKFRENFKHESIDHFIQTWHLHTNYHGDRDDRTSIREVYKNHIVKALQIYGNRLEPNLVSKNEFILKALSGYVFSSKADIRVSLKSIETESHTHFGKFFAYFTVNEVELPRLEVDASLFELIKRINHGYRPSKHDRDATIILEEFVEFIRTEANAQNQIIIRGKGCEHNVSYDKEYDEIQIS